MFAIQGLMWKYFAFCFCPLASQFIIIIITFSHYYLFNIIENKEKKSGLVVPNSVVHWKPSEDR